MPKAPLPATKPEDEVVVTGQAEWVATMHAHFHETGQFRIQDVRRVLGDQGKEVGTKTPADHWLVLNRKF